MYGAVDQIGDGRMRHLRHVDAPQRRCVVIEPLHGEAVQIDEIAWNVQPDQLPVAITIVEATQHHAFYDVVGVLHSITAPDQGLARLQPEGAADRIFQPRLLFRGKLVPKAAFQEQFSAQNELSIACSTVQLI